MGPDDPRPGKWGVRDRREGQWVMAGDEVDWYELEFLAEQAARSRRYLGESRIYGAG
jgi:hypothetical protein